MSFRNLCCLAVLAAGFFSFLRSSAFGQAPKAAADMSDAEIRAILSGRLDPQRDTGIVAGLIHEGHTHVIAAGKAGPGNFRAMDGDTVFEIGSATKVFTAVLLADMMERGEMRLDDPAAKYLPSAVRIPSRNNRQITLLDLATHTSGLPRLPSNLNPKDPANPYADYSVGQLYAFLSGYALPRDIGEQFEYSNLGMGLLGHILALKAGTTYEALISKRILNPLGMKDTAITLSPKLRARMAQGHNSAGSAVADWDLPTLAGAGALRSTVNDMLRFVSANLAAAGPLAPALRLTHESRRAIGTPDGSIGLAWLLRRGFGTEIVWHNGGTGGFHSFLGFDPKIGDGVVILHNSAAGIDDIGFHLINGRFPMTRPAAPPKSRREIAVDSSLLDSYVGEYELAQNVRMTVTNEGGQLFIQVTGQSRLPVYAESEAEFFYKVVDAQVTFVIDPAGQVTGIVLHQGGRDTPGKKVKLEPLL